jgi:hypothetical protein
MWEIAFSQQASNYAIDSHPYNEDVLIAIEMLAFTADGLPGDGYMELEPDIFLWQVAGHSVLYRRMRQGQRRLWIAIIKPNE